MTLQHDPLRSAPLALPDNQRSISRRQFLAVGGLCLAGASRLIGANAQPEEMKLDVALIGEKYRAAQGKLKGLITRLPYAKRPVLLTVSTARRVFAECSALEGFLYAKHDPEVALGNHEIFFENQRADGLIPAVVSQPPARQYAGTPFSFGHIQQNVPLARTAWELAQLTRNESFLAKAYAACGRFDHWMGKYRNTRGTGLAEMFCEVDMGLDYSPRVSGKGIPFFCPNNDATICAAGDGFPLVAPDLSAVVYGTRVALAKMAEALDKPAEARTWRARADEMQGLLIKHCFEPADDFFYDRNLDGSFRKIRETQLFPVLQEHLVDQRMFARIYHRYIRNPHEYWTPYPFPSVSVSDPRFAPKKNSWSGAAIANLALRALLWMPHYGQDDDYRLVMRRWVFALGRQKSFETIIHPVTGEGFSGDAWPDTCTSLIMFTEFVDRLGLLQGKG